MLMKCEKCGAAIPQEATKCHRCGAERTPKPHIVTKTPNTDPRYLKEVKREARSTENVGKVAMCGSCTAFIALLIFGGTREFNAPEWLQWTAGIASFIVIFVTVMAFLMWSDDNPHADELKKQQFITTEQNNIAPQTKEERDEYIAKIMDFIDDK